MAKLYFRYGTVGSSKTMNLLAVAYNYRQQGKNVFLLKPELDTRFGERSIRSRAGLEQAADILVHETTVLEESLFTGAHCLLVDEAQFLSIFVVEQLRQLTITLNVPVICYGLRTDFKGDLFVGSRRLMELADSIEEVKTTCHYCNRKATMNMRVLDGKPTRTGDVIVLGADERYLPACYHCYREAFLGNL